MRTIPILATGIALVLAFGTATAVAASNESSVAASPDAIVVETAASGPAIEATPVVVVGPVDTAEPELAWSAPTSEPAPTPAQSLAPGVEVPAVGPVDDGTDQGMPIDWSLAPAYVPAHCSDVVPQSAIDALYPERGFTLYGIHFPVDWYFPWQGYPADELAIMQDHWIANCTWNDTVGTSGHGWHVDFGAGLDASDVAVLQQQSADWQSILLSTGDTLLLDASRSSEQFPFTRAYVLQDDRWMRIVMLDDTDAPAFAEYLLGLDLTW